MAGKKNFLEHYEKYKDKIFNYFWYRLRFNRQEAEDLTSEVFLKAYAYWRSYDPDRPFSAWIFRIAHNHLVNFYKLKSKVQNVELFETADLAAADDRDVEIDQRISLEQILRYFPDLSETGREILTMRYINDLSNREIAEVLSKEEGAVRTAISRALKELREIIKSKLSVK